MSTQLPWFKFYGADWLSDPKIGCLSPAERSLLITIFCLANVSPTQGIIEHFTLQDLMMRSGIYPSTSDWEMILNDKLQKFISLHILKQNDNGSIEVLNWHKRQEKSLTGYERIKRYRMRKKSSMITDDNADNRDDTEMITIEEEGEEDKDIYTPISPTKKSSKSSKKKVVSYSPEFQAFWDAYPEKIGKGKAWEAWEKIPSEDQALCLQAIQSQVASNHFRGRDQKDYIPHPTTWLNQRRWEDEVKIGKTPTKSYNLDKVTS